MIGEKCTEIRFQIPFLPYSWTWTLEPFVKDPYKGTWIDTVLLEKMSPYSAHSPLKWERCRKLLQGLSSEVPVLALLILCNWRQWPVTPSSKEAFVCSGCVHWGTQAGLSCLSVLLQMNVNLSLLLKCKNFMFYENACHVLYSSTKVQIPTWVKANIAVYISHFKMWTSQLGNILYLRRADLQKNNEKVGGTYLCCAVH